MQAIRGQLILGNELIVPKISCPSKRKVTLLVTFPNYRGKIVDIVEEFECTRALRFAQEMPVSDRFFLLKEII